MTLAITVLENSWTQVNTGLVGTVGNFGERDIHLLEQSTKPAVSVECGHPLRPGENVPFSLLGENLLWARSIVADSKVLVSTGIDPSTDLVFGNRVLTLLTTQANQNQEIIDQLKLLNLRTEEMGNTGISIKDIEL